MNNRIEVIAVVGPTGSGKGKLAKELWKEKHYPLLSFDSRKTYKNLDIGTNKLGTKEIARKNIDLLLGGIDICELSDRITVHSFKKYAYDWLNENNINILKAGGFILFGGTGLYLDAVLFNLPLGNIADQTLRGELERLSREEIIKYAKNRFPQSFGKLNESDAQNPRRLIRLIENNSEEVQQSESIKYPEVLENADITIYVPEGDRNILNEKLKIRVNEFFAQGWINEVREILKNHDIGTELPSLNIMGYKSIVEGIRAGFTNEQIIEKYSHSIITEHIKYAKRQLVWCKRYEKPLLYKKYRKAPFTLHKYQIS